MSLTSLLTWGAHLLHFLSDRESLLVLACYTKQNFSLGCKF